LGWALAEDAEDVVLTQERVGLTIELHFGAAVLGDEDDVALLDGEGDLLAVVIKLARAERDDLALLGLLFGGVGNDDPALFDFLFLERLHENAVAERLNCTCHVFLGSWFWLLHRLPRELQLFRWRPRAGRIGLVSNEARRDLVEIAPRAEITFCLC